MNRIVRTLNEKLFPIAFFLLVACSTSAQHGASDPTFLIGGGLDYSSTGMIIQSDGKILITGHFTTYNGVARPSIMRINPNGTLDLTFNPGTGTNMRLYAVGMQSDGKFIIGGEFSNYNGAARAGIARVNADGSHDATFNPGTGVEGSFFSKSISSLVLQGDGKIVIAGNFTGYNGTAVNRIARVNTNGTLDATFNSGTGAEGSINGGNSVLNAVTMQSDGKFIIVGDFTTYNGVSRRGIARVNTDGSLDLTFDPGSGLAWGYISTSAIQTDGKIIAGGNFGGYNGTAATMLTRLNTDGSVDATFNQGGTGLNNAPSVINIQPDGRILIGGGFTTYNGVTRNRLARLNANGSLDATFATGNGPSAGPNSDVFNIVTQSDGKIIIGGVFTAYSGTARNKLARIISAFVLPVKLISFTGIRKMGVNVLVWKTAAESDMISYDVERSSNGQHFETIATVSAKNGPAQTYLFEDNPSFTGKLFYRLKENEKDGKVGYSNVIAVSNNAKGGISISPNPVKNVINIRLSDNSLLNTEAILLDSKASIVLKQKITGNLLQINAAALAKGIYFVRFADGSVNKLIKE